MPVTPGREVVYAAAATWRDHCLRKSGSVFSNRQLWTAGHATELLRDFVDAPEEGERKFLVKLRDQLSRSSAEAKQLAGEMLWLMMLFPTNVGGEHKLSLVRNVWEWSGEPLPTNDQAVDALMVGIGSGGPGYNNYQPLELQLVVRFTMAWKGLDGEEQSRLLADGWAFAAWFDAVPGGTTRQLRHMLLHLLFPNDFERVSSRRDKRRIDRAFRERLVRAGLPVEERGKDLVSLDRRLARLRRLLEAEFHIPWLDFYETPTIRAMWQNDEGGPPTRAGADGSPSQGSDASSSTVSRLLQNVLNDYSDARQNDSFANHRLTVTLRELERALKALPSVAARKQLLVRGSFGKGNWARVPWVALLHIAETRTTQHGVYAVFLFREDMTGVYVTFNQGVTEPRKRLGRTRAREELQSKAEQIRKNNPELGLNGFLLDERIDLRASGGLGRDYEDSTIAYKLYQPGAMPSDAEIDADIDAVLIAYEKYLGTSTSTPRQEATRTWIFQANPESYDVASAARSLPTILFELRQQSNDVRKGDLVYLWQAGRDAGIVALAEITTEARVQTLPTAELRFARDQEKFAPARLRASLEIKSVLERPLLRRTLLGIPGLRELSILRGPQETNFRVNPEEAKTLAELYERARTSPPKDTAKLDLAAVVESFSVALGEGNLQFGLEIVRAFVASLATKRFVILTGLSGSGKTQLAMKFGEWCGTDRVLVIPVRPDWTGPEYLLGYEDALLPTDTGRRAWHVPEALEFILAAASDAEYPYVLVLDEMNLAHVERYFADVLSGIESDKPCIPNLSEDDGYWRLTEAESAKLRFPDNLFIVGTVNIDETTFMFSPKVLDRANTIEFRIHSADLSTLARKPKLISPGPEELVRGFLEIARDIEFHVTHEAPELDAFQSSLKTLHDILAEGGFEFGHRTFFEAVRFAAMLTAAGESNWPIALDFQLLQKLLPRLHGARRKLEPLVKKLEEFCTQGVTTSNGRHAAFPRSLARIRILSRSLQANQFAGFIE